MDTPAPWVLLRRGKPRLRFAERMEAMRFYDQLRRNATQPSAALFGPSGEAWYCAPERHAQWQRDDGRRRREETPLLAPEDAS